jgi:lysozyme
MTYQFSRNGADFLKNWEGFRDHVYQNPGDVPTIGIGTTFYPGGRRVAFGDPIITLAQAEQYVEWYMDTLVIPTLTKYVKVNLTQNQVDALSSFIYNEGASGFIGSHLLNAINTNEGQAAIIAEFEKWVYVDHQINDWQVKRRAAEAKLYFS